MSPVAGVLLVVAMLFGGFWMPVSAEDALLANATPTVTDEAPVVTPEVTVEPTTESTETPEPETPVVTEAPATEEPEVTEEPPATEAPAVETPSPTATTPAKAPAKVAPQVTIAATGEVNFQVSTADSGPIPAGFKICTWDPVNATQCSAADVSTWDVSIPEGEFDYWTEFQEPYLEIDVYDVPVAAGESLQIPIVLELAEMVDVTFDVSTSDGGAVPAGLQICVSDPVNGIDCSDAGATTWTVPVLSQGFNYWTQFTDPYIDVDVDDVTLPAGEPATIAIVLEPEPELFTNITKTVSDNNPAPGTEITYTVHAWGTSPHNSVEISDFLPFELTNETFSCEIAAGAPEWSDSCDDWWIEGVGLVYGGIDPDDQGNYDVTFTVTATVPEVEGVLFVNTACAFGERETMSAQAAAPIVGEECAAVTVVTQGETEPASVTVNVTTADDSPIPAETTICVETPVTAEPACSAAGASSETFGVAAGVFYYYVFAPGHAPVMGSGEVVAGDTAEVDVVLVPEVESDIHITKTASDESPLPGDRISYEIHVWGTTPSEMPIQFVDLVPAELSEVRVSCELITGWTDGPSCAYPYDGRIVGSIMPDDYNDDSDVFEMVVTVTGTVSTDPGVTFTNIACVVALGGEQPPVTERQGVRAFAQVPPGVPGGACDAATVMTQEPPAPAEGQWGAAAMTVDVTEAMPGDPVTYTLTLPWEAAEQGRTGIMGFAQLAGPNFVIIDAVPQALTNVAWSCAAVNATCAPASGTGYDVTAEGVVLDPARDALVTLTITGSVADDAPAGAVVNRACVTQEGAPECLQAPEASFVVLAQPVDPTVTPAPTEPATPSPTATPDPAAPTATVTATPAVTPAVTGLPSTGAAPGGHATSLALFALAAAALLTAGAMVLRGERARR
ncbi:MAG TPA: hypothetical protein VM450_14745 [Thermomicrobiales bacterium]|nr:hypothetical protein [Thermomicrobiales bacterium]